ncbi:MAG: hypothetical protein IJ555_10065 [Ruminococcus sp.]|nr:hypothetical protein [Ruminococcus sp.]
MKIRSFAVIITAVLALASCGKIEEPAGQGNTVNVDLNSSAAETQEITTGEEDISVEEEETTAAEDADLDAYIDDILSVPFGFELYIDGHTDSWEQRYEAGRIILEGAAKEGTELLAVDSNIGLIDMNALETKGFMTWLKFEDTREFRVGNTIVEGSSIIVVSDGEGYLFAVDDGSYTGLLYEFDKEYVDRLIDLTGTVIKGSVDGTTEEVPETESETETAGIQESVSLLPEGELYSVGLSGFCKGKSFDNYGGQGMLSDEQADRIVRIILSELGKEETLGSAQNTNFIDYKKYQIGDGSFFVGFEFREETDVAVGDKVMNGVWYISAAGSADDGYLIQIDGGSVMTFDPEAVEKIIAITEE